MAESASALTVRDVAAYLNVNEKTVYRLAQRRELPGNRATRHAAPTGIVVVGGRVDAVEHGELPRVLLQELPWGHQVVLVAVHRVEVEGIEVDRGAGIGRAHVGISASRRMGKPRRHNARDCHDGDQRERYRLLGALLHQSNSLINR